MKRRVTHQDIAQRLGVDKSTVSLALRNHPGVAEETRARVKSMAETLGYRPDPALATLARQRWAGHETGSGAALAYLVDRRMANFSIHRRFFLSASLRAEARGYRLHEFDLADYPSIDAAGRVLINRGIRGLLVPQFMNMPGPGLNELPLANFTVVCLDLGWGSVPFHIVAPDIFEITRRVWMEAIERGYERIGGAILSHSPRATNDTPRLGASVSAQMEWIPPERRLPLLTSNIKDQKAFLDWMRIHRPDVVIGLLGREYQWLVEAGWRVPEEVAFVSLCVVPSEFPHHSGFERQETQIGLVGVDVLIAAMNEGEWGIPALRRRHLLDPNWREGATLPVRQPIAISTG